jgi:hypothetical protein
MCGLKYVQKNIFGEIYASFVEKDRVGGLHEILMVLWKDNSRSKKFWSQKNMQLSTQQNDGKANLLCSPVYSTGHMATNAGLLKPGSDVVY